MATGLRLLLLSALALLSSPAMAQKPAAAPAAPKEFELGPLGRQLKRMGDSCPRLTRGQPVTSGDWTQSMQFSLVDGPAGKAILVAGGVDAGDAERLRAFIASAPQASEILLDSPGGDAAEGPKIGRVIRAARLATRVASGYLCASSCTFAFLGGVVRRVEPGASYSIHTFFSEKRPDHYYSLLNDGRKGTDQRMREFREEVHDQERSNAMLAGELQLYTQQMGVARAFMTNVIFPQKSLVFLTDAEIRQLQANGTSDAEIATMLQTDRCMAIDEMRKYNVVNVAG